MIGRPKDLLSLIHGELAAIKGTRTLATLINLIDAFAAEHMSAREEHFDVVAILRATPASHLWLPKLVFHARNVQVEGCELTSCSLTLRLTLQLLLEQVGRFDGFGELCRTLIQTIRL